MERALIIDGQSLKHALALEESVGEDDGPMLRFTNTCVAVVCSRVSPKQVWPIAHCPAHPLPHSWRPHVQEGLLHMLLAHL